MNPRPSSCCQYNPTTYEHYANILTHAVVKLFSKVDLNIFFDKLYCIFKECHRAKYCWRLLLVQLV